MTDMIRETIKEAMQLKGVSAASLAKETGINKASMSKYLNEKNNVSLETLEKMMQALKITLTINN